MIKRYKMGKSHVTFTGSTIDDIEAKKEKYEKKKNGVLQESSLPEKKSIKKETKPTAKQKQKKVDDVISQPELTEV